MLSVVRVNRAVELYDYEMTSEIEIRMMQYKPDDFVAFVKMVKQTAESVWPNIQPKDANSFASDYYEYYDKELDNNGYLSINRQAKIINYAQVTPNSKRVYRFNKRKMESFLYDLLDAIGGLVDE